VRNDRPPVPEAAQSPRNQYLVEALHDPFIQKTAPAIKSVVTADYEESLDRLVRGEAAAALSYHVGSRIADGLYPGQVRSSPHMFLELPFAVAVPKGKRAELLARLNAGIASIRADGTWRQINLANAIASM
jgi:polar amino acid transport system substrate-binding protein